MDKTRSIVPVPSTSSKLSVTSASPLVERGRQWLQQPDAPKSNWPMLHGNPGRTGTGYLNSGSGSARTPFPFMQLDYRQEEPPLCLKLNDEACRIVTSSGNAFVGTTGLRNQLRAFQPATGAPSWVYQKPHGLRNLLPWSLFPCSDTIMAVFLDVFEEPIGDVLYQLDPATGAVVSETNLAKYSSNWFELRDYCLRGTTLCIANRSGEFYGIETTTGMALWQSPVTGARYNPFVSESSIAASDREIVFVRTCDERLAAISTETGNPLWYSPEPVLGWQRFAIYGSRITIFEANGRSGRIYDANLDSCNFEFVNPLDSSHPVAFANSGRTLLFSNESELACFDIQSGEIAWKMDCPPYFNRRGAPICSVDSDNIYAVCPGEWLYAIDSSNGHTKWLNPWNPPGDSIEMVSCSDRLIILDDFSIRAYDCMDGSLLWANRNRRGYEESFQVTGNSIYFRNGLDDRLVCLDAANGQKRWTANLREPIGTSPSLSGNGLYVGSSSRFTMRDTTKDDDREDESFESEDPFGPEHWGPWLDSRACTALVLSEDHIYVGTESGSVYAIATRMSPSEVVRGERDFDPEWAFSTVGAVQSTPAINEQLVFFGCDGGMFYAIEAGSGTERWSVQRTAPIRSSPALLDDVVFVGGDDGIMACYDADSGKLRWSFQTSEPIRSSPAVASDMVLFGSVDGSLYAVDAHSGIQHWEFATSGPIHSSAAVWDDIVSVGSDDGQVYAVDLESGIGLWSFLTGGTVRSSPAIGDGAVCVGSDDHNIYFLDAFTGRLIHQFDTGDPVPFSPLYSDGDFYCSILNGEIWRFSPFNRHQLEI